MICRGCGVNVGLNERFCHSCGTRLIFSDPNSGNDQFNVNSPDGTQRISDNILLYPDGKYRWIYEMSLFKNPTVIVMIWKIFFFVILGVFLFMLVLDLINEDLDGERLIGTLSFFGIFLIGMTVIVGISYLIYAAVMGGKYIVMFEMDEKGVNHMQLPKQAKKAEALAMMTALIGLMSNNHAAVAAGVNASGTSMYTAFSSVRSVRALPRRNLIKVNERLYHNQVYAAAQDYDFVLNFICIHTPETAVKKCR